MLIAGNWKMNTTGTEARSLTEEIVEVSAVARGSRVHVAICPPSVNIDTVVAGASGSNVLVGGQNIHQAESGAFTGEVSGPMLRAAGCFFVIHGHSERRQ
jgi:triosephosphate isomerase